MCCNQYHFLCTPRDGLFDSIYKLCIWKYLNFARSEIAKNFRRLLVRVLTEFRFLRTDFLFLIKRVWCTLDVNTCGDLLSFDSLSVSGYSIYMETNTTKYP